MKLLLTPDRIRTMIDGAMTEKDIERTLRAHKVRFHYDTSLGFLAIRVPCRSGSVLICRTASQTAPFRVAQPRTQPETYHGYPFPVPRFAWDD